LLFSKSHKIENKAFAYYRSRKLGLSTASASGSADAVLPSVPPMEANAAF
jgi:hypothetical protein